MSTTYDQGELTAISVLRLKAKRDQLCARRAQIEREASAVTPLMRQEIEHINEQIKSISIRIYKRTGEYE